MLLMGASGGKLLGCVVAMMGVVVGVGGGPDPTTTADLKTRKIIKYDLKYTFPHMRDGPFRDGGGGKRFAAVLKTFH